MKDIFDEAIEITRRVIGHSQRLPKRFRKPGNRKLTYEQWAEKRFKKKEFK